MASLSISDSTSTERVALAVKHVQWLSKNRAMSYADMLGAAIVRYALTDKEAIALRSAVA